MLVASWELQESTQEVMEARTGWGWGRAREAGPHGRRAADRTCEQPAREQTQRTETQRWLCPFADGSEMRIAAP